MLYSQVIIFIKVIPNIDGSIYNFLNLGAYCRLCHVTSLFLESPLLVGSNKTDSSIYQCPQPGDPHTFTDCCIMEPNEKPRPCCEPKTIGFLPGMDDEYAQSYHLNNISCDRCLLIVLFTAKDIYLL